MNDYSQGLTIIFKKMGGEGEVVKENALIKKPKT